MTKYTIPLILLLLFLCIKTKAQNIQIQEDFGIWIGFDLKIDLPKKFELSIEQQLRTWKNTARIDKYFVNLGADYKINKNFTLNGDLRYIYDTNKFLRPRNSLRYNIGIQLKLKFSKPLHFFYRVQYQQRFDLTYEKRKGAVRHKAKLQFKYKKKHKFYSSTELFVESDIATRPSFSKLRFNLGDKIKLKTGTFDAGIGYQFSLDPNEPFSLFFLKFIYTIKI